MSGGQARQFWARGRECVDSIENALTQPESSAIISQRALGV